MKHYAIRAADRMVDALDENASVAKQAQALAIGCRTLERLARDSRPGGSLWRDLERLSNQKKEYEAQFMRATENVNYFAESFQHMEEDALLKAGASKQLVQFIFEDVESLLAAIRRQDLSSGWAMRSIEDLRRSVCSASLAMDRSNRLKQMVTRSLYGVAGAGVVAVNGSTDAVTTLGLLPWMTAVSGGLGCVLLGRSIGGG